MASMLERRRVARWTTLLVLVAAVVWWTRATAFDSDTPYLPRHAGAEWIVYPLAPSARLQNRIELETSFTRDFQVAARPDRASLRLRARRAFDVVLNGSAIDGGDGAQWKVERVLDLGRALREGHNELEIRVRSDFGPPALWCVLELGPTSLASDSGWSASTSGAVRRPARLARTPLDQWATPSPAAEARARVVPAPLAALRSNGAGVLALLGLGAAGTLLWSRARTERTRRVLWRVLIGGSTMAWILLFTVNAGLDPTFGFDVDGHVDYVRSVLERGELPLADQGWQAYQPPLYYLAAAGLLRLLGYATFDDSALAALRWLGCASGIVQVLAVAAGARIVFGAATRAAAVAVAFAAFVPMQLYLAHYPTNEGWAAALSSVALALTLKLLASERQRTRDWIWLGLALGAALLTKFSALIPLACCSGALALDLWWRDERRIGRWLGSLGVVLAVVALLAGWHYARVTAHFGTPIVGNWDVASGHGWWQQPGYRTADDFLRFGRVLEAPVLSGMHSIPDALHSTLWGDGMIGGSADPSLRPPWRWEWVSLGYLVAFLPAAALLVGLFVVARRWLHQPTARDALLLASPVATGVALATLALGLPFYAQAKAFYGGAALLPLALFAAQACELVMRRGRALAALCGSLVIAGAAGSYLAHWSGGESRARTAPVLPSDDPAALVELAIQSVAGGDRVSAEAALQRALALDPDRADTWNIATEVAAHFGDREAAVERVREALRCAPENSALHALAADVLWRAGAGDEAALHVALALELDPTQERALRVGAELDAARPH